MFSTNVFEGWEAESDESTGDHERMKIGRRGATMNGDVEVFEWDGYSQGAVRVRIVTAWGERRSETNVGDA